MDAQVIKEDNVFNSLVKRDTKHSIVGAKEKNRMEHAHIENGRRSTSKKST